LAQAAPLVFKEHDVLSMASRASLLFIATCTAAWFCALPAGAQTNTAQKATAEAYFDDALRLMQSGNFADACPKLEASQRLDPAVGTLLYLGECYERRGRSASAWVTFREAEALARATSQPQRAQMARSRIERLQPTLSRITVEVSSEARSIPGLRVMCGTVPIDPALPAVPVPVDPGELVVEASAPGYSTLTRTVMVPAAGKVSISIPALTRQAGPAPSAGMPATASPPLPAAVSNSPPAPAPAQPAPRPVPAAQQSLAWPIALGAIGVVGIGVGTVFGVRAINKAADANDICPDGQCRESRGTSLMDSASTSATVSNVAFTVGAVALVGGVVFYLVDKPKHPESGVSVSTWFGPERAGLVLGGSL
jgi:hypothetical protein